MSKIGRECLLIKKNYWYDFCGLKSTFQIKLQNAISRRSSKFKNSFLESLFLNKKAGYALCISAKNNNQKYS
jgi:hypothetical protein